MPRRGKDTSKHKVNNKSSEKEADESTKHNDAFLPDDVSQPEHSSIDDVLQAVAPSWNNELVDQQYRSRPLERKHPNTNHYIWPEGEVEKVSQEAQVAQETQPLSSERRKEHRFVKLMSLTENESSAKLNPTSGPERPDENQDKKPLPRYLKYLLRNDSEMNPESSVQSGATHVNSESEVMNVADISRSISNAEPQPGASSAVVDNYINYRRTLRTNESGGSQFITITEGEMQSAPAEAEGVPRKRRKLDPSGKPQEGDASAGTSVDSSPYMASALQGEARGPGNNGDEGSSRSNSGSRSDVDAEWEPPWPMSPPGRSALPEVAEEQIVIDEAVITEEPPVNEANTNPLLRYITTALPPENRKETAADVPEQPSDQTSPPTRCKGHFENSNTRGEDQPGTSSSTLPTETGRRKRSNSTREELPLALFLPPSVLQGVGVELEVYLEPAVKRRATPVTRIPRPSTCCISSTTGQIAVSVGGAAGSFGDESSGLRAGVMRSTQAISSTGIEAIVLIGGPIVHSVPHPTKLVSMQRREVVTSASRANDEPSGSTPPAGSSGQGANGGQGSSGGAPGPSTSGNSAQGQSPGSSGGNSGQPRDTVFRSFVIVNSQEDGEASVTIRNQNEYVSGTVRTIIRKVISMSASVVSRNYGTQASTSGIRPTPRTASVRGTVEPYEQRQFPSTHHSFTRTSQVAHSSSTLPSSSRDNVALSTGLPSYTTIGAGMIVAARPTESSAQHVVALGNSESTSFSTIDALFSMNRAEQPSESFRTVMDSSNNAPNLSLQANVPTYTTAFYQGQVENTRRIANETFSRTMADHRSAAVSGAMLFGSHALDNTRQSRELAEFVVHREETAASVASFRATANGGPSCSDDEEEEEEEMREFERKSNCMSDSERSSSASTPSSLERSRNSTREPSPVADREDGEEDSRISELDDIPAVNESEDDHPSSFSRDTEPFGLEYDNLRPSIPRLPRNDSFDGEIVPSLSSNIENGLESIKQQATSTQEVQTPAATPFSSGFLPGQPAQMYYQQAGTSNGYAAVPQHPYAMMNQPQYQANGPSAVSPSVPVPSNSLPPEQAQNMTTPSNGAVLNVTPRSSQQNVSSATAVASANNSPLAQPNQHHAPPSQFYSQGFPPYMQMGYPDSQRTLMMHQQQQMHMQAVAAQRFAQSNGFMQHQQFAQSQQNQQNWQGNVYDSYSDQVIIGQPGIDFGRNIYGDSARSAQNSALADPVAASEPPPPVPAKGRGRRATQNRNETGKPGRGRRKNQNDTEKRAAESIAVTPGTSSQMNAESYGVTAVECQQRRVALERGGTSSRALQNYPQTPALSQAMEAAVPRVQFHKQFSQQTYMQHPPQVYPNAQNDALRMPPPSFAPPRHPLNHGVMQSRGYPHNGQHNGSSVMPRPFMDASYFESARGQHEGTIVQMSSASTPESVRMNHSQTPTGGLTPPSSMNGRPSSGASPSNLNDVIAQQKSAQQAANHMPPRAPSVRARYPMMHPDHPQRLPMVMPFGVPSRAPYPNSFNGHPHQMEQNPPYFGQTEHPQFYPHPQIPHSQYQRNMMSVGNGYLQPHAPPQQINPTTSPSTSMTGYPANPNSFAAPEQVFQQSPNPVHPSSDIRQRQFEQQNRENVNTQPSGVGSDFAANGDQSRLSYTVSNSTLAAETGTSEHSENCWRTASRATHPSPVESNPAANTQAREDFRFFDQSKSLQSPLESAAPRLGPFADAYKPTNLPLPTPPLAENQNRLESGNVLATALIASPIKIVPAEPLLQFPERTHRENTKLSEDHEGDIANILGYLHDQNHEQFSMDQRASSIDELMSTLKELNEDFMDFVEDLPTKPENSGVDSAEMTHFLQGEFFDQPTSMLPDSMWDLLQEESGETPRSFPSSVNAFFEDPEPLLFGEENTNFWDSSSEYGRTPLESPNIFLGKSGFAQIHERSPRAELKVNFGFSAPSHEERAKTTRPSDHKLKSVRSFSPPRIQYSMELEIDEAPEAPKKTEFDPGGVAVFDIRDFTNQLLRSYGYEKATMEMKAKLATSNPKTPLPSAEEIARSSTPESLADRRISAPESPAAVPSNRAYPLQSARCHPHDPFNKNARLPVDYTKKLQTFERMLTQTNVAEWLRKSAVYRGTGDDIVRSRCNHRKKRNQVCRLRRSKSADSRFGTSARKRLGPYLNAAFIDLSIAKRFSAGYNVDLRVSAPRKDPNDFDDTATLAYYRNHATMTVCDPTDGLEERSDEIADEDISELKEVADLLGEDEAHRSFVADILNLPADTLPNFLPPEHKKPRKLPWIANLPYSSTVVD